MTDTRTRLIDAGAELFSRQGYAATGVKQIVEAARAPFGSVYHHFPGGKEQLTAEAVTWEVARYFIVLVGELEGIDDLATRLEQGIIRGRALMAEHAVLQKVVDTEPERLLPHLSQSAPLVQATVRDHLRPFIETADLVPGTDPDDAADFLARNVLSLLMASGSWDLADPAQVRRLVRTNLLAGILRPTT